MFLHLLNDDQKRACVSLVGAMVTRDGTVDSAETNYLKQLMIESGLGRSLGEISSTDDVDLGLFDSSPAKFTVVTELLIMSILDGSYDDREAEYVHDLVDRLKIGSDDHEALCRVAEDAASALAKMHNLVR